ncbi:MAG TPA: CYTH and CHAD domain-containing protein [Ilumatobacteraceae bacterium]|nr:CYTH and CHAD domain-containing protein [Ilumatobacteraceae bacterium]
MIEREIKLAADVGMEMPDLTDAIPNAEVGPVSVVHLDAVYYDTPTLSLARAGITLRARTGEPGPIWTLKLPTPSNGDAFSRHEFTFDEPLGPVPTDARLAACAHVRSQSLGSVVRLHTERSEFTLSVDGLPQLKVCDDVVSADGGAVPATEFREIEVEFAEGVIDPAGVDDVLTRLKAAGCHQEKDPIPKALRALGVRAFDPPDVVVTGIDKRATVKQLVSYALSRSVSQLLDHHAGVLLTTEPEHVHQFRVATRRLRSDLGSLEPLLDGHWTTFIRDELRWLAGEVGRARDAEVLVDRLRAQVQRLTPDDARAADGLLDEASQAATEARQHAIAAMSTTRYQALLDVLVEAARDPHIAADPPGLADQPSRQFVAALVRKPWKRVARAVKALDPYSPDAAFHAVRIKSKRARYAAEAVEPAAGRDARRFAEAVAELQSVLGDYHDSAVAEAWLRSAAKSTPSTRLVAGELIALEREDRARLRKDFDKVWKKTSRPKLRKWMS